MKLNIIVDIPDKELNGISDPFEPMNINTTLDYGNKVVYGHGQINCSENTIE